MSRMVTAITLYVEGRNYLFFSLFLRNIYSQMLVCSFLIFLVLLFTNKGTSTTYYGNNALYSLLSTIKKHLCCYTMHLKLKMKHIWSELRSRHENDESDNHKHTSYQHVCSRNYWFSRYDVNIILTWMKYQIYENILYLSILKERGPKANRFINFNMFYDSR